MNVYSTDLYEIFDSNVFFEGSDNVNKHNIPLFVVDFFSSLIIDLDQSNNKTTNKVCHIDAMI